MKDAVHNSFLQDLKKLLILHDVERIEADDHYQGFPECGRDIRITVEFRQQTGMEFKRYIPDIEFSSMVDEEEIDEKLKNEEELMVMDD